MAKKPLILVTNDDGITSKGIRKLVEIAQEFGEVIVVAPDSPQSGMGHAITIGEPLRFHETEIFDGVKSYQSSGTPADCVKLAKHHVLKDRNPDIVLSGINHGSNSSISILYSGTMSAAIEAAIEGIPAIGFSLCDYDENAEMSHIDPFVRKIIDEALKHGIPKATALNVNFPAYDQGKIKDIKICRQARAKWQEVFDERESPYGSKYYWLAGDFVNLDKGEDTDQWAIDNGYVSIVPCQFDLTAHHAMGILNQDWDI